MLDNSTSALLSISVEPAVTKFLCVSIATILIPPPFYSIQGELDAASSRMLYEKKFAWGWTSILFVE